MAPFDLRLLRLVPQTRRPVVALGALGVIGGLATLAGAFALTTLVVAVVRGEPILVPALVTLGVFGVRGLLALRGDLPEDGMPEGHLPHADSLVRLIRRWESARVARLAAGRLAVGVACYPNGHAESATPDEDIDVLLAKQRLGADFAITQLFFDAEDFLRFAQRAELAGVKIPLIPGIMPMTSLRRLERMGQLSGLTVPERVRTQLAAATTPEEEYEIGMELTAQLARTIVAGGADGLHIYTHNNPDITQDLLSRIGVDNDEH